MTRRIFLLTVLFILSGTMAELCSQVRFNELMSHSDTLAENYQAGVAGDWLELFNYSDSPQSMLSYFLSDERDNLTKWKFPSSLIMDPGEYLVLRAEGIELAGGEESGDEFLHLNFRLEVAGECLYLYSPTEGLMDSLLFPRMYPNISYGLSSDGDYAFFSTPTPGGANEESSAYRLAPKPVLEQQGGWYPGALNVSINGDRLGTIRYTLDGSIPEIGDLVYKGPILISQARVLRARQWKNGTEPGETVTATYLIGEKPGLPVISLSTDPDNLWSDQSGIYVTGTNGISGYCSDEPRNYNQDWEIPASLEYFDREASYRLQKDGGVKIHGGCSRGNDLKSLAFIARNVYGSNEIHQQFFRSKDIDNFKALVLRNAGNDSRYTFIRDAVIMSSVEELDLDQQAYEPVILYINGEYWGMMNLREKANEHWVRSNYGIDPDSIDFMENKWQVFTGDRIAYDELTHFLENNSLEVQENYNWVADRLDINSYIDYLITQMYYANRDWPGNNQKCWRERSGGKWRYLMFDLEYSMGLYNFDPAIDMFSFSTADDKEEWPNPTWATLPIRRLLENQGFREEFIRRYQQYLNTTLSSEKIIAVIDSIQAGVYEEFPAHSDRWTYIPSVEDWEAQVETLREFVRQRPAHVRQNMKAFFGLGEEVGLEIEGTEGRGHVLLNGQRLPSGAFTGSYLGGIDLDLDFVAAPGYRLRHWEVSSSSMRDTLLLPARSSWKYSDSGVFPGSGWNLAGFDDGAWSSGEGELGYGDGGEATVLDFGGDSQNKHISYYFRKTLSLPPGVGFSGIEAKLMRDDGAVIYVNGQEALRVNMPGGEITTETNANPFVGGDDESTYFSYALAPELFTSGENIIAVEIHQSSATSSDISFDLELSATMSGIEENLVAEGPSLRKRINSDMHIRPVCEEIVLDLDLRINEIMSDNRDAFQDDQGRNSDWIEVYNAGPEDVDMAGLYFTDSLELPIRWRIPGGDPGQTTVAAASFLLFYADGKPSRGPRHLDFKLSAGGETLGLSYQQGPETVWLDSLSFPSLTPNLALARYPDGEGPWRAIDRYTPGESNIYSALDLHEKEANFRLWPNPARDWISLDFAENAGYAGFVSEPLRVSICDQLGREVLYYMWDPASEAGSRFDISQLDAGLYFIVIRSGGMRSSGKFIKATPGN